MIDAELAEYLKADATIAALVGDNVFYGIHKEGAKNGVVYQRISDPRTVTLDKRTLATARWQFSAVADGIAGRDLCLQIHEAVVNALSFLPDVADHANLFNGAITQGGTVIQSDVPEDVRGPEFDYERLHWRCDADFILLYQA